VTFRSRSNVPHRSLHSLHRWIGFHLIRSFWKSIIPSHSHNHMFPGADSLLCRSQIPIPFVARRQRLVAPRPPPRPRRHPRPQGLRSRLSSSIPNMKSIKMLCRCSQPPLPSPSAALRAMTSPRGDSRHVGWRRSHRRACWTSPSQALGSPSHWCCRGSIGGRDR
jgi:hypothetical protein